MYFSKLAVLAAVPLAVTATILPRTGGGGGNDNACNTGPVQCCTQLQTQSQYPLTGILALLGVVLGPVTALIGSNCSPLSVIAAAGNSCSAQPVCCTNTAFNGLVNVGCTPVNVNV
ncbi:hydrophobin-319 [Panaeolus papilionaceus]|nr:hydrophobin-319 [Panaeolus papilionaceus]